ncbi:MAG: TetR/AcrR family transcriptional regulator [Xanthobacteraceae bacterium]|nr:MAG: TetR/AcrR family transcriptional regulator [Xanthobacteraceae bacterium]
MARKTGASGAATLKAIRQAGLKLMAQHGYEAMSLRHLAAEVGIQAGSLYNHIATKQELLVGLIRAHMEELIRALDAALDGHDDPADRLRAFVAFHVGTHLLKRQEVYVSTFELRALERTNYAKVVRLRRRYEQRLTRILDDGKARRRFVFDDTRVTAYAILAMLTGVCTWYRPKGRLSRQAIIDIHTRLVMKGVGVKSRVRTAAKIGVKSAAKAKSAAAKGRAKRPAHKPRPARAA